MNIAIEVAGPGRRETLANLFQLYVHDFSDFKPPLGQVAVGEDGRFPPYPPLDRYWRDAGREVLFIRVDGALAGFALINDFAHSGLPTNFSIAEFFVLRTYRRAGVGRAAALAIIGARPGRWEIAVARRNPAAQAFWRAVAAMIPGAAVEELDHQGEGLDGQILRFTVSGAA